MSAPQRKHAPKGVTRVPFHTCPSCGYRADAQGTADGTETEPVPGDVSLCMKCGHGSIIADDLTNREPTPAEKNIIDNDPEVHCVRRSTGILNWSKK